MQTFICIFSDFYHFVTHILSAKSSYTVNKQYIAHFWDCIMIIFLRMAKLIIYMMNSLYANGKTWKIMYDMSTNHCFSTLSMNHRFCLLECIWLYKWVDMIVEWVFLEIFTVSIN